MYYSTELHYTILYYTIILLTIPFQIILYFAVYRTICYSVTYFDAFQVFIKKVLLSILANVFENFSQPYLSVTYSTQPPVTTAYP